MAESSSSVREVLSELRGAQKSSSGAPAYSRFVNRPIGRVLAAFAYRFGLRPDQVTLLSALATFTGIALIALAPPTAAMPLLIVLLLVLGYALDSADGQLARLRGGGSPQGEWLDHVVDATKIATMHLAVLVCWWRFYAVDAQLLLIPLAFQVISSVFFFGVILTELLRRGSSSPQSRSRSYRTSPLYSLLVLPADYGLLIVLFALLGIPWLFIPLYSLLCAANGLILLASLVRWHRSLGTAAGDHA
ncbi:CDP-alcohol phosphatidyltransferase family protein [Microbacterium sp. NPDC089318]